MLEFLTKKRGKRLFSHAASTDTGKKYGHNEDSFFLPEENPTWGVTHSQIKSEGLLYLLCDGMGGGNAGEVASSLACGWLARDFYAENDGEKSGAPVFDRLSSIVLRTHASLRNLSAEHEEYKGMGTTLVVAHIKGNMLTLVSLGDSRCYLLRKGNLKQLTEDHSEIWPLYANGSFTKEELRLHPRSNVLSRALIVSEDLSEADLCIESRLLEKGDLLLICSDGLTDMVPEDEIVPILKMKGILQKRADTLVEAANAFGGRDNITVMLVAVG